jgi:hypothetical protein
VDTTYVSIFKGDVLQHKDTLYAREIQAKAYALIDNELYSGGTISSDKLKDLVGIRLKYECPWVHQTIIGFSMVLLGESQNPIVIRIQGENLSAKSKAELLNFTNPKTLYIEDIQVIPITHQKPPSNIVLNIK